MQSSSPPVQGVCIYASCISPHPDIIDSEATGVTTRSAKSTRLTRKTYKGSYNTSAKNQKRPKQNQKRRKLNENFSFTDFQFKGILGQGRSGKTLLCEFRGNTIALKSADLSKAPSHVLKEMQNEVEIYKILANIQGKYIPKLECYGYYGGGMCYVIGTTLRGTALSNYKRITDQQRIMGLQALRAIHDKGVLHNDIREENILLDNSVDGIYLIDFGMASYNHDAKKKSKLFNDEKLELHRLLDQYTTL